MQSKLFLLVTVSFLLCSQVFSQNFSLKSGGLNLLKKPTLKYNSTIESTSLPKNWDVIYGSGEAPSYQMPNKIKADTQGDLIVAGSVMDSSYGMDLYVRKFDMNGNQLWYKKYRGLEPGNNSTADLAIDGNDNIYVLGKVYNPETWYDIVILKYSPDGTELWSRSYDGSLHGTDYPSAMKIDENNNVYVTGWVSGADQTYNLITLKYDSQGNRLWDYTYTGGNNGWVYGYDLSVDSSGSVYTAAAINDTSGNYDLALIKLNMDGAQAWMARFDNADNNEEGLKVNISSGNNIIVCGDAFIGNQYNYLTVSFDSSGDQNWVQYQQAAYNPVAPELSKPAMSFDNSGNIYTTGENSNWEMLTYKITPNGVVDWQKTFTPSSGNTVYANVIKINNSSNILIAGYGYEPDSSGVYQPQASVLEYDSSGTLIWSSQPSGIGNALDLATDDNGNSYITGFMRAISSTFFNQGVIASFDASGGPLWTETYTGDYGNNDAPNSMVVDNNGNILISAESVNKNNSYDYLTLKYDDNGNNIWAKRYESSADTSYRSPLIASDNAGNVFVTGYKQFRSNNQLYSDFLTVKYDANGNLQWSKLYHDNDQNLPVSIQTDNNGDVIILGYWQSNGNFIHHIILVKYSSSGQLLWDNDVNQDIYRPVGLQVDSNGNSYVASQSAITHPDSSTNLDYNLLKFSPAGSLIWSETYNDSLNLQDYITSLILGRDNSIYVTGYINTYTKQKSLTIKYDASGQELWSALYDSLGTSESQGQGNHAKALGQDSSGNVYVTGYFNNGSYDTGIFLLKYDESGNQQRVSVYNCPDRSEADDYVEKMLVMDDGTVYLPGHFYQYFPSYSLETIKFLPDGSLGGVDKYQILTSPADVVMTPADIAALPSGDVVEVASALSYNPYWQAISIIDYSGSSTGISDQSSRTIPAQFELSQNYPNPFNPSTKINFSIPKNSHVQIDVFNLLGQRVRTLLNEYRKAGNYTVNFDASTLASGVYLYRIQAGNFMQIKKMVLMK